MAEDRPLQNQYYSTQSPEPVTVMEAILLTVTAMVIQTIANDSYICSINVNEMHE